MDNLNIALDPTGHVSLQNQLRQKLVDAIYRGVLRSGSRLPSSRKLAQQLKVSRNTVSLVYDALLSEGHLVSRPRSGIYVASDLPGVRIATGRIDQRSRHAPTARALPHDAGAGFQMPANWHQYPYPFIQDAGDAELLPVDEWREAVRLACTRHEIIQPGPGTEGWGDENLIEQLRSKILPIHGIVADADQVVAALSARHALHMVASLLVRRGTAVLLEEPADSDFRYWLQQRGARVAPLDVQLNKPLPHAAIVITSPLRDPFRAHPDPARLLAAVTVADGLIIEQDAPPCLLDRNDMALSLLASDDSERVIHVGGLSPLVSCDTPLGIVVAPAMVTRRLHRQRRAHGAIPSALIQRSWAYFIGLGHYAAALARANGTLERRLEALRDALNHYLHRSVDIATVPGHGAYWVRLREPCGMDAMALAQGAARNGVLVTPLDSRDDRPTLLMGIGSIAEAPIRPGVHILSRLIQGGLAGTPQRLADESVAPLEGNALQRAMAGITLVYNTVYGEPCTLELARDGSLRGVAGQAAEDCDSGRWWIENDRWFRQWQRWAYGEAYGFTVVIDGDQVRWYDDNGLLADVAVISRGNS